MKKLLFLLLLIPFLGNSQATFTAPVGYNTGVPSATPSGVGTRWRFDLLTGKKYTWLPGSLSWDEDARGIDQVAGCSAPLYTPGYNQSTFAVNSCTVPELYQWTGAAWVRLNEGEVYTAGTGISIDGSNVITNTSPNVVQTLSIAGQDLTLSGGGGTVAIPGGASDALGTGFTSGGGTGTIPAGTVAGIEASGVFQIAYSNLNPALYIDDAEGFLYLYSLNQDAFFSFEGNKATMAGGQSSIKATGSNTFVKASTAGVSISNDVNGLGAEYAADYSATIVTNPTSITDVASVNLLKQTPVSYTNAAAPNNCIFYSTTLSKLAYKDPGGTVNPLY